MANMISCDTAIPADRTRAIKARQQAMWASGDYAVIGNTLQIVGELLNEVVDVRAGHRVLDVAAGSGTATLAAARRFATVTSTDYVPAAAVQHDSRVFAFRYRSPEHWVEVFRSFYGPIHTAFLTLDAAGQDALEADLIAVLRSNVVGGSDGLVVPAEFLETVITT